MAKRLSWSLNLVVVVPVLLAVLVPGGVFAAPGTDDGANSKSAKAGAAAYKEKRLTPLGARRIAGAASGKKDGSADALRGKGLEGKTRAGAATQPLTRLVPSPGVSLDRRSALGRARERGIVDAWRHKDAAGGRKGLIGPGRAVDRFRRPTEGKGVVRDPRRALEAQRNKWSRKGRGSGEIGPGGRGRGAQRGVGLAPNRGNRNGAAPGHGVYGKASDVQDRSLFGPGRFIPSAGDSPKRGGSGGFLPKTGYKAPETATTPSRRPTYDPGRDAFIYPDGRRVRGTDPAGNRGRVREDGSIEYSDGTVVSHDTKTGVTTITRPDGTTETRTYRRGNRTERPTYDERTDTYVYSDGMRVRGSDPSGNRGRVREDGSIEYSDGTVVVHDTDTGETIIRRPDGTTRVDDRGSARTEGPEYDPETDSYVYDGGRGPGTRIRGSDPSGARGEVQEDGSILYSDGTRVTRDSTRGITRVFKPDGSTMTYYSDGTVVTYDASTGKTTRRRVRTGSAAQTGGSERSSDGEQGAEDESGSGGEDDSGDAADSDSTDGEDEEGGGEGSDSDGDADGEGSDDADGETDGEDATEYTPGAGRSAKGGPKASDEIDEIVARKTGAAAPAQPDRCDRPGPDGSGPTMKPRGGEEQAACAEVEGGVDTTNSGGGPSVEDYAWSVDSRTPASGLGPDCDERVMDCEAGPPLRTVDPFDRSPVINPNPAP
ncbi:MAG TPA: hypothetical protein ENJ83_01035 [Rhodospirillales bacterium]|nr:hypothetical protein [Rhodospirillales bacterium]